MYTFINISPFTEHIIVDVARFDAHEYDITIFEDNQQSNFMNKGSFFKEQYCKCLLHKLFNLPKSKVKPFIQYQCLQMKEPIIWLNKFEKLIDLNRDFFTEKDQVVRFDKALMIIEVLRDAIEKEEPKSTVQFNFHEIKTKIKQYDTVEEKLSFLMEAKTEYLQNKPKLIDPSEIAFDEKINLELELLKSKQKLSKKTKALDNQETNSPKSPTEISRTPVGLFQFNCQTNVFVDIFFQLTKEITVEGKPLLNASFNDLSQFIAYNFIDKNGNPLSLNTVKTILNTSRPEKRPSLEKRIKLKTNNL